MLPHSAGWSPQAGHWTANPMADAVGGRNREHVVYGMIHGVVHRAQVWTDREWAGLPESSRPSHAQRLPGLGWLVIGPLENLEELRSLAARPLE